MSLPVSFLINIKHVNCSLNYSQKKEEQLDCLLVHFTKCAIFCENMFDQLILKLQRTTKNVVEVKAVKVIFANVVHYVKKNCISSHVTILYYFFAL